MAMKPSTFHVQGDARRDLQGYARQQAARGAASHRPRLLQPVLPAQAKLGWRRGRGAALWMTAVRLFSL